VTDRRKIDDVLAEARHDLRRLTPAEADAAARDGAVLVDVRSEDERRRQGVLVPGALTIRSRSSTGGSTRRCRRGTRSSRSTRTRRT
jgi:hypothetical protein